MPRKPKTPEERKLHLAYKNMIGRCYSPTHQAWANYGGRGIRVCEEWRSERSSFVEWARANGHSMHLSIDRIDVDGDYTPENCRWATISEQSRNRRRTLRVEGACLADLVDQSDVRYSTAHRRLTKYGKSSEEALMPGRINAWAHGTRQGYEKHGCRCFECRASNAMRHRLARSKKQTNNQRNV